MDYSFSPQNQKQKKSALSDNVGQFFVGALSFKALADGAESGKESTVREIFSLVYEHSLFVVLTLLPQRHHARMHARTRAHTHTHTHKHAHTHTQRAV